MKTYGVYTGEGVRREIKADEFNVHKSQGGNIAVFYKTDRDRYAGVVVAAYNNFRSVEELKEVTQ